MEGIVCVCINVYCCVSCCEKLIDISVYMFHSCMAYIHTLKPKLTHIASTVSKNMNFSIGPRKAGEEDANKKDTNKNIQIRIKKIGFVYFIFLVI